MAGEVRRDGTGMEFCTQDSTKHDILCTSASALSSRALGNNSVQDLRIKQYCTELHAQSPALYSQCAAELCRRFGVRCSLYCTVLYVSCLAGGADVPSTAANY
jgi:hypothetical protein